MNALRHADFLQLHCAGGPKFRSVAASFASALHLTAYKTIASWPRWVTQLEQAASHYLSGNEFVKGARSTDMLDSPQSQSICKRLSWGSE